ncbi:MAG: hypothetical protein JSU93_04625 [Methanobacteriota archaeon]|nr:MAG: hypothetical protein JSU93_04625 [Euryarchaeota archaeon]
MRRRSAVPLAIENMNRMVPTRVHRKRILKLSGCDPETCQTLSRLAENRARIERLESEVWQCSNIDCSEIVNEIELLRANIELGLVEIAGGLEEARSSEEVLAEGMG